MLFPQMYTVYIKAAFNAKRDYTHVMRTIK